MPDNKVYWVNNGDCDSNPSGSENDPFCEITDAYDEIVADGEAKATILIADDFDDYESGVTVSGNRTIAIVARDDAKMVATSGDAITVSGAARMYLSGFEINNEDTSDADAVSCDGSDLWIQDMDILDIEGGRGLVSDDCSVVVELSLFKDCSEGAVEGANDTIFAMYNTAVAENGTTADDGRLALRRIRHRHRLQYDREQYAPEREFYRRRIVDLR